MTRPVFAPLCPGCHQAAIDVDGQPGGPFGFTCPNGHSWSLTREEYQAAAVTADHAQRTTSHTAPAAGAADHAIPESPQTDR